jgi:HK97 family phage major capsid protein
MIASNDGIPTSRDVSADNTATAITADGLINAKYSLKAQYHSSEALRWIFHRDAIKMIRKLKADDGQYIWQPGLATDRPDTILDVPYIMSEYAPNTFTTGLYVGILGDFSHYWIADAMTLQIQRLVELYAESNQVGFIGRLECDGMPVLAEAFARVKLG